MNVKFKAMLVKMTASCEDNNFFNRIVLISENPKKKQHGSSLRVVRNRPSFKKKTRAELFKSLNQILRFLSCSLLNENFLEVIFYNTGIGTGSGTKGSRCAERIKTDVDLWFRGLD